MSDINGADAKQPADLISDWYLPSDNALDGWVYPKGIGIKDHRPLWNIANELLSQCKEKTKDGYHEFTATSQGRRYRGHMIEGSPSQDSEGPVFALRRLPDTIPSLEVLGLPDGIRSVLMDPWLSRGGLVLICGETGQGKSTTCAATVRDRMQKFNAFCLTVEDPVEMPLAGQHGFGRCIQTEVRSGNFAEAMKGAMRCYPTVSGSMMYVGETRDSETAAEVLKIAMNGHLVLTTIHAGDIVSALQRFAGLAMARTNESDVLQNLASVLRLCMHQQLEHLPPVSGQPPKKRLNLSFLMSRTYTTPVGQKIKDGKFTNLGSELDQQRRILEKKGMAGLRELWS